jgi:hypothetical protein
MPSLDLRTQGRRGFDYIATIGVCRIAVIVGNVVTVIRLLVAGCSWMVAEEVPALSRLLLFVRKPGSNAGLYAQAFLFLIYFLLAVWGLYQWRIKDAE